MSRPAFWSGKRVFLTGHTGFKGGWMALWLQQMGAEVTGFALAPPTVPSLFEAARVGEGMRSIVGDVRDAAALADALRQARPEIVIHMAAQPLVRYSYLNPVETYATNLMGLVHLFEAVRRAPEVRAVVNVTSDKCYENREWVWGYRETEPMGGYDPYSSSKGCAELITAAYRRSFFNPEHFEDHGVAVASARAGNVIGGGDWAEDRLIPDILRAFEADREVLIRSPGAIRPWQHVLEPLSGYLLLAQALFEHGPAFGDGWNFGPRDEDARPVQWIVERLTRAWGGNARYRVDAGRADLHEAHHLKLDCSKAHAHLHWRPRWSLEQALQQILEWHKSWLDGADMRALTLQHIQRYNAE